MVSDTILIQSFLQPHGLEEKAAQTYTVRKQFSVHLGFDLKVQLEENDVVRFFEDTLLVFSKDSRQEVQHAIPLQSLIYVSVP